MPDTATATQQVPYVAKSRKPKPDPQASLPTRDRVDMRVDPPWLARVERQADRLGISVTAYIKMATSRQLEADESSDPTLE